MVKKKNSFTALVKHQKTKKVKIHIKTENLTKTELSNMELCVERFIRNIDDITNKYDFTNCEGIPVSKNPNKNVPLDVAEVVQILDTLLKNRHTSDVVRELQDYALTRAIELLMPFAEETLNEEIMETIFKGEEGFARLYPNSRYLQKSVD